MKIYLTFQVLQTEKEAHLQLTKLPVVVTFSSQ
jgi:hypothetical protein